MESFVALFFVIKLFDGHVLCANFALSSMKGSARMLHASWTRTPTRKCAGFLPILKIENAFDYVEKIHALTPQIVQSARLCRQSFISRSFLREERDAETL